MLDDIDPNTFFLGLAVIGLASLIIIPIRKYRGGIKIKWAVYAVLCVIGVPAIIVAFGMGRMSMENPERLAHYNVLLEECLAGSNAPPDRLYCEILADDQTDHVPNFMQEILASATYGKLVPHSYPPLRQRSVLEAHVAAERLARLQGDNGSTRFTGAGEEAAKRALFEDTCALNDPIEQSLSPSSKATLRDSLGCEFTFEELQAQGRY